MPNDGEPARSFRLESWSVRNHAKAGAGERTSPGLRGGQIEAEESFFLPLCGGRYRLQTRSGLEIGTIDVQDIEGDVGTYQGEPQPPAPNPQSSALRPTKPHDTIQRRGLFRRDLIYHNWGSDKCWKVNGAP